MLFDSFLADKKSQKIVAQLIIAAPIIITIFMVLILISPSTKSFGFWALAENNPVELLTFIFLFIGGSLGIYLTFKLKKNITIWESIFYGLFSFLLFFCRDGRDCLGTMVFLF